MHAAYHTTPAYSLRLSLSTYAIVTCVLLACLTLTHHTATIGALRCIMYYGRIALTTLTLLACRLTVYCS